MTPAEQRYLLDPATQALVDAIRGRGTAQYEVNGGAVVLDAGGKITRVEEGGND